MWWQPHPWPWLSLCDQLQWAQVCRALWRRHQDDHGCGADVTHPVFARAKSNVQRLLVRRWNRIGRPLPGFGHPPLFRWPQTPVTGHPATRVTPIWLAMSTTRITPAPPTRRLHHNCESCPWPEMARVRLVGRSFFTPHGILALHHDRRTLRLWALRPVAQHAPSLLEFCACFQQHYASVYVPFLTGTSERPRYPPFAWRPFYFRAQQMQGQLGGRRRVAFSSVGPPPVRGIQCVHPGFFHFEDGCIDLVHGWVVHRTLRDAALARQIARFFTQQFFHYHTHERCMDINHLPYNMSLDVWFLVMLGVFLFSALFWLGLEPRG